MRQNAQPDAGGNGVDAVGFAQEQQICVAFWASWFSFWFRRQRVIPMPSTTCDLKELIRSVLADGAHGLTLRTGELPVVYSDQGRRLMEMIYPTHEDIISLLRQLTKSRQLRQFRELGVVRFLHTFEGRFRLVGAARIEKDDIHVELRRMAA